MKDLLSEVLRRKRFCLEKCDTSEEVLGVFGGLLTAVGKAKRQSVAHSLASLLSDAILAEANEIAACNALRTTDIGEVDAGTGKSGSLDKVNDDCLKLCLEYVPLSERMDSVEVSCLRLFHLSRTAPYHFRWFDGMDASDSFSNAIDLLLPSESRLPHLALRFQCVHFVPQLASFFEQKPIVSESTVRKCAEILRWQLTHLVVFDDSKWLLDLTFPKLQSLSVNTFGVSDVDSIHNFLRRHGSVAKLQNSVLSSELLAIVCEFPHINRLSVGSVNPHTFHANPDVTQFTDISLSDCTDFGLLKKLLHSKTERFIVYEYNDSAVYREPLQLPSLTHLQISFLNAPSTVSLRNLNLETSAKMETLICTAPLRDLDEALRLCPNGRSVHFTVRLREMTRLEVSQLRGSLLAIFSNTARFRLKSLELHICAGADEQLLESVRDFVPFFVMCRGFLEPTTVTLTVCVEVDGYLERTLGQEMMDELNEIVEYKLLN